MSEPRIEDFARGRNFLELNQMRCGPVASIDSIGIPMDYWHSRCPRSDRCQLCLSSPFFSSRRCS